MTERCMSPTRATLPSASCWCSSTANTANSERELRYVAIAASHQRKGLGKAMLADVRAAEAARGAAAPRRRHQLRRHRQPRLLPAVRLPVALDRARLLHPGPRVSARLRPERAARGRHGVDGPARLMGRFSGIALDVTPLRESREFRLLWAGDGITAAGSQFTRVAAAFQVYELTGSTLMVGLLGLVTMVPLFFGSILGGAVADHFERRRVILLTQLGGLLCALALALNAAAPNPQTWVIFVVFFLAQGFYSLGVPASRSAVQMLVRPEHIPSATALEAVLGSTARLIGPVVAGFVIASAGLGWTYVVDMVSFALCICLRRRDARDRSDRHRRDHAARDRRRSAVPAQPGGAQGLVPRRPRRDDLRDAGGALPGARRPAIRRRGLRPRPPLRRSVRGLTRRERDQRVGPQECHVTVSRSASRSSDGVSRSPSSGSSTASRSRCCSSRPQGPRTWSAACSDSRS